MLEHLWCSVSVRERKGHLPSPIINQLFDSHKTTGLYAISSARWHKEGTPLHMAKCNLCMLGTQTIESVGGTVRRKSLPSPSGKLTFPHPGNTEVLWRPSQDENSKPTRALHMAFKPFWRFLGIQVVLNWATNQLRPYSRAAPNYSCRFGWRLFTTLQMFQQPVLSITDSY